MQVFERLRSGVRADLLSFAACAAVTVLTLATAPAWAQHVHGGKVPELGMSVAVDAEGRLWAVSKEASELGQFVVLQTSADMGRSWSPPRRVQQAPEVVSAEGENRPKLAFGSKGEIYITYTKPLAKPYTGEIRFLRSTDGGRTFTPPQTVHANRDVITHRFESMIVGRDGRIYVAWIDKRDVEAASARKQTYAGAALYYAVSDDGGVSFRGDYKVADHSCECCRIALALNPQGRPVAFWRHVFAPNVRDHALAELRPDGKAGEVMRVTFDDWRIDACPHHGPALAFGADGTRHQAWFNGKNDEGGVFYAATSPSGVLGKPVPLGSSQAGHADITTQGSVVALAWKQFDGKATVVLARLSQDGGQTWQERQLARTAGASDQPRLLATPVGIALLWRTQDEGIRTVIVTDRSMQ